MTLGQRSMPCLVAAAVFLLVLAGSANGASAGEETAALDRAIGHYWDGLFSDAVAALDPLADSLEGEKEILAREYLARSLVRLGEEDRGREAFKALLRIRPDWRPDTKVVAGPEMSAFEAALEEYENENLGALSVRTDPTRANVVLDGELEKEPTPVTIERIPAGEHRVRVERDGYAARDTVVTIAAAEIAALDLVLVPIEEHRGPAPFWKKRWVQVTAGGVFGVGLLLALAGGGGDGGGETPSDLPGFPEPPHR
ncbi:MAG: PEGA domain-containing protein [Candidatus Eisenbacteria bacterium]|nr:PEGA domain-containing protein [Candidatus Eisenbacteria bacterium]